METVFVTRGNKRRFKMRNKYILSGIVVGVLLASVAVVLAGQIDSPAGPTATGGQMYTLEQIYDRIDDGTAATKMTTFTEPSSGPAAGTGKTLDEIYDLVGERAPVLKTGQVISYTIGDDGDLEKGVAWPSPRFITSTTGIVTDTLTGLIWLKNANCTDIVGGVEGGTPTWMNALTWSNNLANGDCGLSDGSNAGDWRLPNVRELLSLIHWGVYDPAVPNTAGTGKWTNGNPFTGVQSSDYWSSTTIADPTYYAWIVHLGFGFVHDSVETVTAYVWPVRGGQ